MRDNFEAGWPRREGATRLNDKVKMTKISRI